MSVQIIAIFVRGEYIKCEVTRGREALKNIHPIIPKIITRDIISKNAHFSTIL